jgi:hypothetical protein
MAVMADLTDGRYPEFSPWWAALGQLTNAAQSDIPARSNLEYLGFSTMTDGALAASGVACAVPVPIDAGTVVTNISIIVGGTAASTPTHAFAALYAGTGAAPALIAQTPDTTTTAIAASGVFSFTFSTPQLVSAANAPNGFVYAAVSVTASTVNTAAAISTPTAVGYQWFTSSTTPKGSSPLGFSLTAGSSLGGTAASTLASPAAKAVAPVVILT